MEGEPPGEPVRPWERELPFWVPSPPTELATTRAGVGCKHPPTKERLRAARAEPRLVSLDQKGACLRKSDSQGRPAIGLRAGWQRTTKSPSEELGLIC